MQNQLMEKVLKHGKVEIKGNEKQSLGIKSGRLHPSQEQSELINRRSSAKG